MPLAFVLIWLCSVTDRSARAVGERRAFDRQLVQSEIGTAAVGDEPALAPATP
jgi:cation/acetate symporter